MTLAIYDILGRQVDVLAEGYVEPGWYQVVWNAMDKPSGVYTAVLEAGSQRLTQRMTLIK